MGAVKNKKLKRMKMAQRRALRKRATKSSHRPSEGTKAVSGR